MKQIFQFISRYWLCFYLLFWVVAYAYAIVYFQHKFWNNDTTLQYRDLVIGGVPCLHLRRQIRKAQHFFKYKILGRQIMLSYIYNLLVSLSATEALSFTPEISVKTSPHTWPIQIHGAWASPDSDVYLQDSNGEWHKLEEEDTNFSVIASTVQQRLRYLISRSETKQWEGQAI